MIHNFMEYFASRNQRMEYILYFLKTWLVCCEKWQLILMTLSKWMNLCGKY